MLLLSNTVYHATGCPMRSLASLRLTELILHKVPAAGRHDENPPPVRLSNVLIELTDQQRLYFQDRLRKALGADAREVVESSEVEYEVPGWLRAFLVQRDTDLVAISQRLANKLRAVQSGASNDGLLLVAACEWGRQHAILLAKVELERGIRAEPEEKNGKVTFSLSLLNDLVFGETSRVFKIGLFSAEDLDEDERLSGFAVDRQQQGPDIAGFFLNEYLGCDYAQQADVITKSYFDTMQGWINSLPDDEKRARYEVALLSDLQSGRNDIRPSRFAREHLDEDDRDAFLAQLPAGTRRQGFAKDTALVPIKWMKVTTEKGVKILADAELVGSDPTAVVRVQAGVVTVTDRVADVSGQGRARRSRQVAEDGEE